MSGKNLVLIFLLAAISICFYGCGGSGESYLADDIARKLEGKIVGGELTTFGDLKDTIDLIATKNSFDSEAVIAVTEKSELDRECEYLANSEKLYEINGFIDKNGMESDIPITDLAKPLTIKLKNTLQSDNVEAYFVGVRNSSSDDWHFTRIDNVNNANITTARSAWVSDFYFTVNRLGFQFALFAKINNVGNPEPSVILERINAEVVSASSFENSKITEIRVDENGNYAEDMKISFELHGKNIRNLKIGDYLLDLVFANSSDERIGIVDSYISYDMPRQTSSDGKKYVHRIRIKNINGTPEKPSVILATKGISKEKFPTEFTIFLQSAAEKEVLPFYFEKMLSVNEVAGINPPKSIVCPEFIREAEAFDITWKSGEENATLTYDIGFKLNDNDWSTVIAKLDSTQYSFPAKNSLEPGKYSGKIIARNQKGLRAESDVFNFEIVGIKPDKADFVNLKPGYRFESRIELEWKKVTDSLGAVISYDLLLASGDESPVSVASKLSENKFVFERLALGSYSVAVRVFNGLDYSESEFKHFDVVPFEPPYDLMIEPNKVIEGESFSVSWKSDDNADELSYIIVLEDDSHSSIIGVNIKETKWVCNKAIAPGEYLVKVVATGMGGETVSSVGVPLTVEGLSVPEIDACEYYKDKQPVVINWTKVDDPQGTPVTYSISLAKGALLHDCIASGLTDTSYTLKDLDIGSYSVIISATNGKITSRSNEFKFSVVNPQIQIPVAKQLPKNLYWLGEKIEFEWNAVEDPMHKPISYSIWAYAGDKPVNPTYSTSETSLVCSDLATGAYKTEICATNGDDCSEASTFGEFSIIATTCATISGMEDCRISENIYSIQPEFIVTLSENNYEENKVLEAIAVEGIDSEKVNKTFENGCLHITFIEELPINKEFIITMSEVSDKYGNPIERFEDFHFKTVPFKGNGTIEDPFVLDEITAYKPTANGKLPIIGSLTTNVGIFDGIEFSNASIIADSNVLWEGLSVANIGNNAVVDIPDNATWTAGARPNVYLTFEGNVEGKKSYFKTASNTLSVEDGMKITLGNGSEEDPYLIYTAAQISDINNLASSNSCYKQVRDINCNGSAYSVTAEFFGIYDGNGKVIKNLSLVNSSAGKMALFVNMNGDKSVIKNLGIEDCAISAITGSNGALVAEKNNGLIENCYSTGDIYCQNGADTGGLIGINNKGNIKNCYFMGNIHTSGTVGDNLGGLVGKCLNGDVENCYVKKSNISRESTSSQSGCLGGLVGYSSRCSIHDCYVELVAVVNKSIYGYKNGGLVGSFNYSSIKNCYTKQTSVQGRLYNGGLVGYGYGDSSDHEISNCYCQYGLVENTLGTGGSSTSYTGGLAGYLTDYVVSDCYVTDTSINYSGNYVGGLIGYIYYSSYKPSVSNCYAVIDDFSSSGSYIGGLIGYAYKAAISSCSSEILSDCNWNGMYMGGLVGYLSASSDYIETVSDCSSKILNYRGGGQYIGGFVGYNYDYNILNCYSEAGRLDSTGGSHFAGFIGYNSCCSTNVIKNCSSVCESVYTTGQYVGGFMGYHSLGLIENCHSTVNDFVRNNAIQIGGFLGYLNGGKVLKSFSKTGIIAAPYNQIGGFIGYVGGDNAVVDQCFCEGIASSSTNSSSIQVGGFIGYNTCSTGRVTNSYCIGTVNSVSQSGGFIGFNSSEIHNCYCDVTVNASGEKVGTLFGELQNSNVTDCFTTKAGTIAGYGSPSNCYSLPDGYSDSQTWSREWDEEIWDLSKPLPTLKCFDE